MNVSVRPTMQPGGAYEASALERSAVRRAAVRILPILIACYFFAYLDRVNLSFAALQMNAALGLTAKAYGLGAGLFFVTYCAFEVPSNLAMFRVGATKWLAGIVVGLGFCAGGMAFVQGQTSFYAMRLALGAVEAGFYPGVLFFLTLWFPAAYRARIMSYFIAAIPVSGIIGAPLSGALLKLNSVMGLQGWQWLYLLEAAPALPLGLMLLGLLQDGPAKAKFMPVAERDWLVGQLAAERTLTGAPGLHANSLTGALRALVNGRLLLLAAMYFSNVCLLNSITFFMPQIVKGFGFSAQQTGFVVAIPSVLALIALIVWSRHSDKSGERYGHASLANLCGGLALFLSVVFAEPTVRIACLAVAFACTLAFTAPFWTIPATFLAGGEVAAAIAAISALGVLGGIVSPWFIGAVKDATGDFRIGLGVIGVLAMVMAVALYWLRPKEPFSREPGAHVH